uniref:Uncharacterized protein n=1 Tax=Clastoptera arizonana TaxID=38151 RepID=A0A1B6DZR8_9HEMI
MKFNKLSRKSFKSKNKLKRSRKFIEKKDNQKNKKSEQPSDEDIDLSDDELDNLVDSDTELNQQNESIKNKNDDGEVSPSSDDDNDEEDEAVQHKKTLDRLQDIDPEFYTFLKENDEKLLKFQASDNEFDSKGEQDEDEEEERAHKPPEELHGDSEESDFEDDNLKSKGVGKSISLQQVAQWQEQLSSSVVNVQLLTDVVSGFHAALQRVSGEENVEGEYRVDGSSVFNAVIQMCVLELQPAIMKFLKLPPGKIARTNPGTAKKFIKIKTTIKSYLADLLKLLGGVTSPHIQSVLLKHLHQMSGFFSYYSRLTKIAVKKLVNLWSTGEETTRVIAFLCILRLTTNQQKSLLDSVLKVMYVQYISNSKFVSVQTLPAITFMRRSLTELFTLDPAVSYQHAFLYIRQLAIHLRNAITLNKKESIQSVCNWQYMNSVKLWIDLLCSSVDKGQLQALLYPLVQIIIGCIKLVPTAQYIPLRFHYCEQLVKLSKSTGTFIPVLPLIIEAFSIVDVNKRHKKVSMKPMDFTCIFRVSKVGLLENGFKDATVEHVFQLLLEFLAKESYRIRFPDIMVPATIQLRSFLKSCRVSKYSQKIKHLVTKIEESSKFIETERRKVVVDLSDKKSVDALEENIRNRGTPLLTFYNNWKKVHDLQVAKRATDSDKISEFKLPVLKKRLPKTTEDKEGPVELFPSDDSEDDQINFKDEDNIEPKAKKPKKSKKNSSFNKSQNIPKEEDEDYSDGEGMEDIVEEFKLSDIE